MNFSPTCVRHERVKVFRVIRTFEDGAWRLSLESDYQLRPLLRACIHAKYRDRLILDFLCRTDKRAASRQTFFCAAAYYSFTSF